MSDRVSLCIIRLEMDNRKQEKKPSGMGNQDKRPRQKITVEMYADEASSEDLRLLPADGKGSHEGTPSADGGRSEGDVEKIDFFYGNPLTKGVLHLCKENEVTDASEEAPSLTLCLLAVPASYLDLLSFTAARKKNIQRMRIIRESSPHKYMALLTFRSRDAAFEFRETFGGTPYSSLEPGGICQAVWVRRVECAPGDAPPPTDTTKLPMCYVCLERMESVERLVTLQCAHYFHARCLVGWLDDTCPECRFAQSPDQPAASERAQCAEKGVSDEGGALWICRDVGGGRQKESSSAEIKSLQEKLQESEKQRTQPTKKVTTLSTKIPAIPAKLAEEKVLAKSNALARKELTAKAAVTDSQISKIQEPIGGLASDIINGQKESSSAEIKSLQEKLQESEKQRTQLSQKVASLSTKITVIQAELAEEKVLAESNALAREEQISELQEQIREQKASAIEKRSDYHELQGGQVKVAPQPPTAQAKHKKNRGRR